MTALLILLSTALASPTPAAQIELQVTQTRADFAAVQRGVEQGDFSTASFELGGGQNPRQIVVHWEGITDAQIEEDPYADPFRLRRVEITHVMPAVGPATATWFYRGEGELFFAYLTGSDAWDVDAWPLTPLDEIRAYFEDGQAYRVIWTSAEQEGKRHQHDNPLETKGHARTAAQNLAVEGKAIAEALSALAR